MKDPQPQSDSKVTLEALLRLKRAERPAADFWTQFEEDLRRKQLAAIVEKRAWWQVWPAKRVAWLSIPMGAAAALAFTYLATDQAAPTSSTPESPALAVHSDTSQPVTLPVHQVEVTADAEVAPSEAVAVAVSVPQQQSVELPADETHVAATGTEDAGRLSRLTAFMADLRDTHLAADNSVFAALSLSAYRAPEQQGDQVEAEPVSADREAVAAQMRDPRRARLMAYAEPALANPSAPVSHSTRKSERLVSRLSEQALYDSISRLDMTGQSVSIKF